ncbi:MAG: bifunctional proline dehydrogenase/L-glutamate gamma-semialdehyde dehydrogenase PutA [Porticoccaceae bacterium]
MGGQDLDALRRAVREHKLCDEHLLVQRLLDRDTPPPAQMQEALERARAAVATCRAQPGQALVDELLREFSLSSEEGILLMCLAESLLRVPDADTADRLIADKIADGQWQKHRDPDHPRLVNAAVWGLSLSRRWVDPARGDGNLVQRLVSRVGEPLVRSAMRRAMKLMGEHYVFAESMAAATSRAAKQDGLLHSYDMLGEGARSAEDAHKYWQAYGAAISALGQAQRGADPFEQRDGISVKLSALHPRYEFSQSRRVMAELLPRLRELCLMAQDAGIGLTLDAEEADRLDLSLDLIAALAFDPALKHWQGLGLAVQAYQKRALPLCHWLAALAHNSGQRLMVRLVKGAYWDTEIKRAQQLGLSDYPVFTRKVHTDLNYLACAQQLLDATPHLFPQFATHNAGTLAMVAALAGERPFELQRLHGMGDALYAQLPQLMPNHRPAVRVYAPVGSHRELLPYLVRRLLENGANSSFIHHFLDDDLPLTELLHDPWRQAAESEPHRHSHIPLPRLLYRAAGEARDASAGLDLNEATTVTVLERACADALGSNWQAAPMLTDTASPDSTGQPVIRPADTGRRLGMMQPTSAAQARAALQIAAAAQPEWNDKGVEARAQLLDAMAGALEANRERLIALLAHEGGRTLRDGVDEVREAVDFCRYYALQARESLRERRLPGPSGEDNRLSLHGRGVFLCISPWNFPLAIFTGQIAAALVSGNTVLAKPAEATPLVAAEAVRLFRKAGLPPQVLQLLPGSGALIGDTLLRDSRLAGVAFTGSTATAQHINRQLAARDGAIATLIAETGGQNAMLVDSTALPEQVVDDVIASAFHSAGQRCSALRVLFLQEEIADEFSGRLVAALQEQRIGDPARITTDIGPVIDARARDKLLAHIERMTQEAQLLGRLEVPAGLENGTFVAPHIFAIERLDQLHEEVFGPILHIIRYRHDHLDAVIAQINDSGYGLTLGIHSRITGFADEVFRRTRIGNTYVNRTMIGAVVGSQPFGGQGLSGTGPKAGGPHYLLRFVTEKSWSENLNARGGDPELLNLRD